MSLSSPDRLHFRGRNRLLLSHPLEPFLRRLPAQPDFRLWTPQASRHYLASWEVRPDDTLWLIGLKTRPDADGPDPGLGLLFPSRESVAATWVSQTLKSPDTEQRRFSPIGNQTVYARELHLTVYEGQIIVVEDVDVKTGVRFRGELTPHVEGLFGPEEGAFLRAAFAEPNDAAPRLVYADWLEERNDSRAEVVRLAERIRHLDPEAAARVREQLRDLIRGRQNPWPWFRLMGYQDLADV